MTGNSPSAILRSNYAILTDAITANLYRVANALYATKLISSETHNHILTATGISDLRKSSQLVSALQVQLRSSSGDLAHDQLINVCHVLLNQECRSLTDISTSILHELGE